LVESGHLTFSPLVVREKQFFALSFLLWGKEGVFTFLLPEQGENRDSLNRSFDKFWRNR